MKNTEEKIKAYIKKHFKAETTQLIEKTLNELSTNLQNEIIEVCKKIMFRTYLWLVVQITMRIQ